MPLKQLVLNGFKSFADKTTINFDTGITGIVGPNGSGKSNITEAIRWVMGESSAKSLRGENMRDVIFAGSSVRDPLNHAEVSLVFDNKKHELNFDNDNVVITRKILRSGDNDYLINNQSVRLKDIRELFVDSGISSESLAIISQGKVDQILNSRAENRRGIFEEAAGVLHFKQQKEIALRQLEKTNDNLIRINDLVKELEKRVEPLHEQSSLAKQYQFEKKQLDTKLKQLLALQIQVLDQDKQEVIAQAQKSKAILEKLDQEVTSSQHDLDQKRSESNELHAQKDAQQKQLLAITQQIATLNTDFQMKQQSSQYDEATKKEYLSQKSELLAQHEELQLNLKNIELQLTKEEEQLSSLQNKKQELTGNLKQDPTSLNKKLEKLRAEYIDVLQEQTSANNELVYLKNEIQRASLNNEADNQYTQELKVAREKLATLKQQGQEFVQKRIEIKAHVDELSQEFERLNNKHQDSLKSLRNLQGKIAQRQAQLQGLQRLQERHEGYYYGVKYVLNHAQLFQGVIGVIGELITFPPKLQAALTTALGGGVQDLVTINRESARDAINNLKQFRAGRATFLPLDALRQHNIAQSTITTLKEIDGFLGVAADLVSSKSEQDVSKAINYLLGNVLVARDMNTALRIQNRTGHYYRIVTLDGDIISPGGSMTGGAKNQRNNSPLQTSAEIESLTKAITSDQETLANYESNSNTLETKLTKVNQDLAEFKDKLQDINQQITEQSIRYQNETKEVERLEKVVHLQENAKKEKAIHLAQLQEKEVKQTHLKEKLIIKANKMKKQMDDLKLLLQDLDQAYAKLHNDISEINSEIAVANNKKDNLNAQIKQAKKALETNQDQVNDLSAKIESLSNANGESLSETELRKQLDKLELEKKDLTKKVSDLNQELGKLDAQTSQLDALTARNYDLRKDAAQEQEEYSIKQAQLSTQIDQKLDQLSQDYSLTYEAAIALIQEKNTEELRQQLEKEVKLHKMSIEDIGPVNLQSIQEYEDVKARYDFLTNQQNDLLKGRSDIEESMAKLDGEVKSRFNKTFTSVENNFERIFPQMFGGGYAKLILTDPHDLLTTGIEIVAQPPGKKLQKLSLLSGGERALTAITLLFAMLETNPVPFCILDEVEAALDEANVTRFAQFLNHYDLKTQFIVITHRRGTMENADNLYGVVMQESGISKLLSVSLKEIKKEVE